MGLTDTAFWVALMQIIGVNIVLSGDNAVVIALAARSLPQKQQKAAIIWGSGGAVIMRIILTVVAVEMLKWPYPEAHRRGAVAVDCSQVAGPGGRGRGRHQHERQSDGRDQNDTDRRPRDEPR